MGERPVKRTRFGLPLAAAAIGLLLLAGAQEAAADANWKGSSAIWQLMDRCARAARKQYPDYTREANAKREAVRQACLRASNLPVDAAPPPPPTPQAQR